MDRSYLNVFTIVIFISIIIYSSVKADENVVSIHVNKGKYNNYYHIKLNLSRDSILSDISKIIIEEGGMFELDLDKNKFPVDAPNCNSNIILRMPWTDPDSGEAEQYIIEKKLLLEKIVASNSNGVDVIIELNPYVEIISDSPLKLKLTRCNVFFRHSKGRYIDNLD